MNLTLIIGGARSGKSSYAERLARRLSPFPIYLATSRLWDADHQARIRRHQRERGPEWQTIEEPLLLSTVGVQERVIVVDCVTLWLTNYFVDLKQDIEACLERAREEFAKALCLDNDWLFVSNELGQGLHAPSEAGRKFSDLQGFVNQHIAARADNVAWMVAGIPVYAKGQEPGCGP
jgi:adenosylcobinamide kinase/adenosylcobinamide-phosphate guanylyltransferase